MFKILDTRKSGHTPVNHFYWSECFLYCIVVGLCDSDFTDVPFKKFAIA